MDITIFGATGRTGQVLLPAALVAGHTVTALVRDPSRIRVQHDCLKVLPGSLEDEEQVRQAIAGSRAVISVLGPSRNRPVYEIWAATARIIAAMQDTGARRLIVTSGAGVRDAYDAPGAFDRLMGNLVRLLAEHVYEDMRRSVDEVRRSSLDWTIVRVPMLTNGPRTGRVRVGYVGKGTGPRLSRLNLADFLVAQLSNKSYIRQAPAVSN